MYSQTSSQYMPSVLRTFAVSLAFSVLGMFAGVYVPAGLFLPLAILELVMLFSAAFFRRRKAVSYSFLYIFTFISGITIYPVIAHYLATIGANTVLLAFGTTTFVFAGLAVYASTTKRNLSFLGGFLMAALLALVAISIFNIFWPLSTTGMLAYSFIGVMVFSGYVLFDFNRMKRDGVRPEDVPLMALSLYLDFINLFLDILRIFGILSRND
jgi:uncharacterized protein